MSPPAALSARLGARNPHAAATRSRWCTNSSRPQRNDLPEAPKSAAVRLVATFVRSWGPKDADAPNGTDSEPRYGAPLERPKATPRSRSETKASWPITR